MSARKSSQRITRRRRQAATSLSMVLLLAIIMALSAGIGATISARMQHGPQLPAIGRTAADASEPLHEVTIRPGPEAPAVATGLQHSDGSPVMVSCSTCHTTRPPNKDNRAGEDLNEFHQHVILTHGTVSCLSCHDESNYDALKLADGTSIAFPDVMQLCAQCHGPQMQDYLHGAHGGMNGYWDLTRGPRMRNNCVDCHHPHSPAFPGMMPMFKPRDRFLNHEPTAEDTDE